MKHTIISALVLSAMASGQLSAEESKKSTSPAKAATEAYESGEFDDAIKIAKPLAEKGDAEAIYLMGFAHENGKGAEASREKAMEYYRKGVAKKHADSVYRLAFMLMASQEKSDIEEARKLLENQAKTDAGVSGRILGEAFLLGRFSEKPDPNSAVEWWNKSAEAGDIASMLFLARFYDGQMGFADQRKPDLSIKNYRMAAEKGNSAGMVALGTRLLTEKDASKEQLKEGREWLDKAIAEKNFAAYLAMGNYEENTHKDPKAALEAYNKGADAGQVDCMLRASRFYLNGIGTEADGEKGVELLKKAAGTGNAEAHFQLAVLHLNQEKPDLQTAYGHLLTSANGGMALAQNELGLFYLSGRLGAADIPAAVSWFSRAAQSNLPAAQNNLGTMYERGSGVPQNLEQAMKFYSLAAAQGNASATLALARFHTAGAATTMNKPLGWALAKLAGEIGEANAANFIAELEKTLSKEDLAAGEKELARIKSGK